MMGILTVSDDILSNTCIGRRREGRRRKIFWKKNFFN